MSWVRGGLNAVRPEGQPPTRLTCAVSEPVSSWNVQYHKAL